MFMFKATPFHVLWSCIGTQGFGASRTLHPKMFSLRELDSLSQTNCRIIEFSHTLQTCFNKHKLKI